MRDTAMTAEDRPRRRRRPQEKYARLIEAAISVFSEAGYARARVDEICRRAAVSVGTFYDNFENKADLMADVAEHVLDAAPPPDFETVRSLEQWLAGRIASSAAAFTRAWIEGLRAEPALHAAHTRLRQRATERYEQWVREARSLHRSLRPSLDEATAALGVLALLKEAATVTDDPPAERAARYARVIWTIVHGATEPLEPKTNSPSI
jgi:AcrR family transcriptional regulator